MKENCFEAETQMTANARRRGSVMNRKLVGLCLLTMVFLLTACGEQAVGETLPTDMTTQPTTQTGEGLDEGELPQVTIPQNTEPVTKPTQPQEDVDPPDNETQPPAATAPPEATEPLEGTTPPAATEPTEETKPTEPTQGANPTDPTEDTEPPATAEPTTPTDETEPPETTQPPEITEPTEPPSQPGLGDDELPLVPVG